MPTATLTRNWPAVLSVMMGIFSIVTTEILPIGLLTSIGSSFEISEGVAGLMMTLPGILAAISAPALTVATGRLDRRTMLCALMLVLAIADFLAAVAPNYWVMLFSRVLVGLVIGGFWSIGSGLAARLVPEEAVGRATSVIFSAVPLGSVLGVPAGTFVGQVAGWRSAFVVMGLLTLAVLAALSWWMPPLPAIRVTRLDVLRELLRRRDIRIGLAVTALIVTAHFATYTYVTPFLQEVTRTDSVTLFLLTYGIAGVAGNFLSGMSRHVFAISGFMIAIATLALPVAGSSEIGALALLVIWGLAYGAVPACSQKWFAAAAPNAPEAATVLFTSSFQATLSTGALLGGVVVDATSTTTVMTLGGVVALLMAGTLLLADRRA
ncbi:MFS transporter [Allokutzneria albata]|uniref:Predicted arabinose efflux permease, MFS family n=1 Tax=Allokutzneria albata TaxID=211114 RepID=A0A1G9ZTS4_ALLAB|nr:MFS transporter [Allokutzneria albata]SDN24678.1 Predicted arabinose efflux permease, MFS family [Allokutzneria albata]